MLFFHSFVIQSFTFKSAVHSICYHSFRQPAFIPSIIPSVFICPFIQSFLLFLLLILPFSRVFDSILRTPPPPTQPLHCSSKTPRPTYGHPDRTKTRIQIHNPPTRARRLLSFISFFIFPSFFRFIFFIPFFNLHPQPAATNPLNFLSSPTSFHVSFFIIPFIFFFFLTSFLSLFSRSILWFNIQGNGERRRKNEKLWKYEVLGVGTKGGEWGGL